MYVANCPITGRMDAKRTPGKASPGDCLLKVVMEEGGQIEVVDTCKVKERKTIIFTSRTSQLLVYLKGATGRLRKTDVLIQYEGENRSPHSVRK